MPRSLEEQFETTNAVTLCARLFALDRVRTDYLQRTELPIPAQDVQVLTRLTDEMDRLLREAEDRARYLHHVIAEHAEELHGSYERILSEDELTGDQKMQLQEIVMRHGGISEYGRTSAYAVVEMAPMERERLAAEMDAIRGGGPIAGEPVGDLTPQFLCNIAVGCIVGGLLSPPPMNIVAVSIGLLTVVHVHAIGEEC
jgi:hypothetical protein